MTKKCRTGLGLVVGVGNGQLDRILIGDTVQGSGDTAGGSGMHIWGSGVVRDCSDESGLSLDTTRVCLGPLGCHGYDTNHKNLEYFSSSKVLTHHQAHWLEYLSQFNLAICFCPGHLRAKPDALTRCWDVYPKEGDRDYAHVNPHNLKPMFTQEQLVSSLRATILLALAICTAVLVDIEQLHKDILAALPTDSVTQSHLSDTSHPRWSKDSARLLHLDNRIYRKVVVCTGSSL